MIDQIVSHYRILEKLGGGGMGVIYKARDLKLERLVVLKFLPPHLDANADEKKRFVQEAKAASALDHANICTVYEIDETAEGQMFIAMAYYDGETLKQQGARDKGQVIDAVEIAIQIAQGLAKAHEHGIVHRDIKPANIIITKEGVVKIIDFGLAKFLGQSTLTKTGATMGTMAYMAPEQVSGAAVDQRADVWALGAVLYEMLAGQRPFAAENEQAMMYAILCKEPQPITHLPEKLAAILRQALAKEAEARYQRMEEMLEALRSIVRSNAADVPAKQREVSGLPRTRLLLYAAGVICLLVLGLMRAFAPAPQIDSLAVLPFANVGGNPENEYLSDGLSENLIQRLSQLSNLKVISFNVAARYRAQDKTPQEIGNELQVEAVLVGRVAQRGETLLLSAELVSARDSRHLWGKQYERKLNELLSVQEEITAALAEKLQPRLSNAEKQRLAQRYTPNNAAHQLYLKGRYHTAKYNKAGYEKGLAYFRQAVVKDPNYALAYDGLAYYYCNALEWMMSPREALPLAKEAALKALALDETLAEAHASLGMVYLFYDWDWPSAEREFQRALELNPNYATTYVYYAHYYVAMGRFDHALAVMKRAHEIEPLSAEINTFLGWNLIIAGQKELALAQLNNALELDPDFWFAHLMLGVVHEAGGRLAEAGVEYEKASALEGEFSEGLMSLGRCYAEQGKVVEARKILLELQRRAAQGYVAPYFFFAIHFALGEKNEALPWFEKAFEQRCIYLLWDKVFAYSKYQREEPRLAAILDQVGVKE